MKMKQRGGGGDFKSPGSGSTPGSPVGNTKKKRRTSTVGSNSNQGSSSSPMPELIPPPQGGFRTSGFGDTIIASNPFDDTPSHNSGPPPGQPQMPPHMNMNCPPGPPGGPGNGPPMNMGMPNQGGGGMPGMGPGSSPMGNPMGPGGPNGPPPSHMNQGPPSMHMNMGPGGPNGPMSMGPGGPNGPMSMGPGNNSPMGGPGQMVPVGMGQTQWNGPPKPAPIQSGKIYPHDQPMVFNPQNPNAPPIYPCGVCHKEVHDNDQAIPCESGCNFWFHRICTGLTEHAYHFLCQEVYAEWVCDKCLGTKQIPLVKFKP